MSDAARDNIEFQKIIVILGFSLMAVKFAAYYLTGSVAILTDATESIVNVVAACVGMYALYLSSKPADRTHPFGHGKVEIISATIEGTMIIIAGGLIIMESVNSLMNPGRITDLDVGLVLVAVAAIANYVVGRIAVMRGRRNRSPALEASGRHLCSDTYSSVGIIIGLAVVFVADHMGYDARWLDSSIAMLFGAIIVVTGLKVMKECIDGAMDKADFDLLSDISSLINEYRHDDWIDVYRLRLIKYGPKFYIDVHIVYPRNMTIGDLYTEKKELDEAIMAKYGDSVEISMTPVPCREFNCRSCMRNCFDRQEDYERPFKWTTDSMCNSEPHAVGHRVTIHEK